MSNTYFTELQDLETRLARLLDRTGKTSRQFKSDRRTAHAIAKRISGRSRRLYELLGTSDSTANWSFNPSNLRVDSTRRDNRTFRVCDMSRGKLDAPTPAFSRLGGGRENALNERYKNDKQKLDKQASKRSKN